MTDSGSYSRSQAASIPFFTAAMFLVGMQMAETGAALDHMARSLSLDSSEQGLLVSLRFVGGLVVGLFLWAGHARVRFSGALAVALGLVVLSGPLLFVESYAAALAIAGLRGLAMGTVIPLSGMFSAAQEMKPTGQVAAGVNAALSAGMVVLSLVATVFAATIGVGWQAYWAAASIMALLMLILLPFVAFPPVPERAEDRPREHGMSSSAARGGEVPDGGVPAGKPGGGRGRGRCGRLRGIIVYLTQLTQGTT
ncbi:MAG: MFS transporter, partial [Spirochaetaceae bacterium]